MSDIAPEATPVADPTPAAETPPVNPLETPAPAATPEIDSDPFDNEQVQQFDRKYVEKIRKEAADRRTATKKYEDAYAGYTPEEQAVWFTLQQELVNSPKTAAAKFQQIANEILGSTPEATPPVADPEPPAEEPKFLTQADFEAALTQREAKATEEREVAEATNKVVAEAEGLGYKQPNAADASEAEKSAWRELMFLARYEADGDLAKAHGIREARSKAAVEAYLAEKAGQGGIPVSKGAGDTPSQTAPVTSFSGASDALRARLAAQ